MPIPERVVVLVVIKEEDIMLPAILLPLLERGLSLVANAALVKGKEFIEEKTGIKLEAEMSEENILALQKFQLDHQEELKRIQLEENKLEVEHERLRFTDVDSARQMQKTAMQSNNFFTQSFTNLLAAYLIFAATVYIGFITFGFVPEANQRFADTILGFILGSVLAAIIGFYFGSTKNSQRKDDTIQDAVRNLGGGL
jgi:hypothetical protein